MNLKHLAVFLTLAKEKSFTKTASVLGCSQSGVTTQIQLLEASLNVKLFERIKKTVVLTQEGEKLLPYAHKILSLSEEIQTLYTHSAQLSIGASESVAQYLLMEMLKEYTALYPETEIVLKLVKETDYCQMLCNGEIDAAVVLDAPITGKALRVIKKRSESILLTAASMNALSEQPKRWPKDFFNESVLLPQKDCVYRRMFEQKLHAEGIHPKIALESDSVSVIKESSLCGLGLGLLPEFAVKKELIYHMLEKINLPFQLKLDVQILVHPDKWISPALERFLEVAERSLDSF